MTDIYRKLGNDADLEADPQRYALVLSNLLKGKRVKGADARVVTQALLSSALDFQPWSRRYCDGRRTYAPSMHNQGTQRLLQLGIDVHADPTAQSVWASDAQFGLEGYAQQQLEGQRGEPLLLELLDSAIERLGSYEEPRHEEAREALLRLRQMLGGEQ